MATVSKRRRAILEKIGNPHQAHALEAALKLVKDVSSAKFDETVEVALIFS